MGVSWKWGYPKWIKMDGLKWNILFKWRIWGYPHVRKPSYDVHIFLGTSGVSQQEMYRSGFLVWTNKTCGIMWEVKDSWSWTFIASAQQNMPWLCEKGQHCSNFGWVAACALRKLVFLNRQTERKEFPFEAMILRGLFEGKSYRKPPWFFPVKWGVLL